MVSPPPPTPKKITLNHDQNLLNVLKHHSSLYELGNFFLMNCNDPCLQYVNVVKQLSFIYVDLQLLRMVCGKYKINKWLAGGVKG